MPNNRKQPPERPTGTNEISESRSSAAEVDAFLQQLKRATSAKEGESRGRLIFAMDATMSRQPAWDLALQIQADMFHQVKQVGGLDVQLVYFRGFGECRASKWVRDA